MGVACVLLALAPFAVWTARNWQVFHVFEPLAPRYATDPGESSNPGWERWVKTWCLDFVSTYDITGMCRANALDLTKLPSRAFDSPAQYAETVELADDYNENGQEITPELDARFAQLAEERIGRTRCAIIFGCPWAAWPICGCARAWRTCPSISTGGSTRITTRRRDSVGHTRDSMRCICCWHWPDCACGRDSGRGCWPTCCCAALLLMTVEAPEARYTLECFPMLFVLGGVAVGQAMLKVKRQGHWEQ